MIDTHSHIYDKAFDSDRDQAIERSLEAGVTKILMPAIDSSSHSALLETAAAYPGICLPMMGLHPTSVNDNPDFMKELEIVARHLGGSSAIPFCAVGEVGLDLYWSRDYLVQQTEALVFQAELALQYDLPLVVHCRDAWDEILTILSNFKGKGLRGVMHAFSGEYAHYRAVRGIGDFMIGIGGPVTYKNSLLPELLSKAQPEHILLETDTPYLPPVPYRGKRNESSYIPLICNKVAEIMGVEPAVLAAHTTANASRMFGI